VAYRKGLTASASSRKGLTDTLVWPAESNGVPILATQKGTYHCAVVVACLTARSVTAALQAPPTISQRQFPWPQKRRKGKEKKKKKRTKKPPEGGPAGAGHVARA
jgi:glycine/D-amino acid oxidase-like deaminating enzyme